MAGAEIHRRRIGPYADRPEVTKRPPDTHKEILAFFQCDGAWARRPPRNQIGGRGCAENHVGLAKMCGNPSLWGFPTVLTKLVRIRRSFRYFWPNGSRRRWRLPPGSLMSSLSCWGSGLDTEELCRYGGSRHHALAPAGAAGRRRRPTLRDAGRLGSQPKSGCTEGSPAAAIPRRGVAVSGRAAPTGRCGWRRLRRRARA